MIVNLEKCTNKLFKFTTEISKFSIYKNPYKISIVPKCPSTDDWLKKMWYIFTMEYYSAIKKNEIVPFAATWLNQENIILSEVSQAENDKYYMISLICGI